MKNCVITLCAFFLLANLPAQCLAFKHHDRRDRFIFSPEQLQIISSQHLDELINKIISNKIIALHEPDLILDFAVQINNSKLPFVAIEQRVKKYTKNGLLPFSALTKAIDREQEKIWRMEKLEALKQKNDNFTQKIKGIGLTPAHQEKILEAYALCIDAFRNNEDRARWLTPKVCEPIPGFDEPRHHAKSHAENHTSASKLSKKNTAYTALLAESAEVAAAQNLNDFEKIKMVKCISEHALRFFSAYSRPFKAIKRSYQYHQPPEQAFFARNGICGNFSAIAYNIANAIGLEGRVFMAHHHLHTYLEFQSSGEWFHTHPFNSTAHTCDVVRYQPSSGQ